MSFTLIFILVLIAVIVTLGAVIYVLSKSLKAKKKENQELQTKLESAKINIQQLSKYIDNLQKIKNDKESISQKIKGAENDEEVFNIIADIVNTNNNRVQND